MMAVSKVEISNTAGQIGVQNLKVQLVPYRATVSETASENQLRKTISAKFAEICKWYLNLAKTEFDGLLNDVGETSELSYLLHYTLPEFFKDLLLLHRDVLLQLSIGKHKKLEGIVSEENLNDLVSASREVLLDALDFFDKKLDEQSILAQRLAQRKEGIASKIKHHQNPWEAYSKQFNTLLEQFDSIENSGPILAHAISVFREIRVHSELTVSKALKESKTIIEDLEAGFLQLDNLKSKEEIPKIIQHLEKTEQDLVIAQNLQEEFTQSISNRTESFSKTNLPVATEGGLLLEKTVDFGKSVKKWMDFNLLPMVIDIWDHQTDLISFVKHSILNLKGSLTVAKTQEEMTVSSIQTQSLETIRRTIGTNVSEQKKLADSISEKLKSQLLVSGIYGNDEFLEVSLQTSLTQYSAETTDRFTNWGDRLKGFFGNVNTVYDKAVSIKTDSLDTATACIAHRMLKEENAQYDMLFLNKNFLGDLFLTSRKAEEEIFENSFAQWNQGFNKAILLVGDQLSGKSTFINNVLKSGLNKQTVFLTPESTISFEGRKFSTSHNLKEAFHEIKKTRYTSKPIIVLDNLEQWHDQNHSLLNNVRAVISFIEAESDDALLVVTTTKLMRSHINNRLAFSNAFTTQIDLDFATTAEIFNAVRLRHGASHRTMVDESEEPISQRQFERMVGRLCKKFGNNIGEVLQGWTYGTNLTEGNTVVYKEKLLHFPDFFTSEELITLKYVLLYGTVNELTLKTFVGKRYGSGYGSGLKRLANTKVLIRGDKGVLTLNAVVINDIHEILSYKGILD